MEISCGHDKFVEAFRQYTNADHETLFEKIWCCVECGDEVDLTQYQIDAIMAIKGEKCQK